MTAESAREALDPETRETYPRREGSYEQKADEIGRRIEEWRGGLKEIDQEADRALPPYTDYQHLFRMTDIVQ